MSIMGRPTTYEPGYCHQLVEHMAQGYSFESFAAVVKTHKQTLYDWADKNPDFYDAKLRGFAECLKWWEDQGNKGLWNETFKDGDGMTVSRSINATVWRLNMQNRFKWSERQEVKHEGEVKTNSDAVPLLVELLKKLGEE